MNKPEDVYLQIDNSLGGTTTWSTDRIDESDEHYILEEVLREAYTAIVQIHDMFDWKYVAKYAEDIVKEKYAIAIKWLEDNPDPDKEIITIPSVNNLTGQRGWMKVVDADIRKKIEDNKR